MLEAGFEKLADLQKLDQTGLVILSKIDKTDPKFKSVEILNLIGKPDQIPIYRPVLSINQTGFKEYRHVQFLSLQCTKNSEKS
jgi:hypothetical protein